MALVAWLAGIVLLVVALWNFFTTDGDADFNFKNLGAVFVLVILPMVIGLIRRWKRRRAILTGVVVSQEQLPGVYEYCARACAAAGVADIPKIVITTNSGPLSESYGGGEGIIVLHYDIFETFRADGDRSALRFAIAREVGRFAAGHHTPVRELVRICSDSVPGVRGILRRIECYTADRWAAALAPDAAADFLGVTGASKVLWAHLSLPAVARQTAGSSALGQVLVFKHDLPPVAWRAKALSDVLDTPPLPDGLTYEECAVEFPTLEELTAANMGQPRPVRGVFRSP